MLVHTSTHSPFLIITLFISICHIRHAIATCYFPNGTEADHQPCNRDNGDPSMCCDINDLKYECTDDGLCNTPDNDELFRSSCTDPTWKDPACLNLCIEGIDGKGKPRADQSVYVTSCADGSVCCDWRGWNTSIDCCKNKEGQWFIEGKLYDYDNRPPVETTGGKKTNTGAIVGGVVGGVAIIVALAMAFWWFVIRKQLRRREQSGAYEPYQVHQPQVWDDKGQVPQGVNRMGELDSTPAPVISPELDGTTGR